ncbi:MAG: hypothetical protein K1X92_13420, partial [Bacteroidia bacterium]|nr:hypothetical protein [Bacteroidia bacterium]
ANNAIIKNDLLAGVANNAVSITNGTGQIVGGLNATVNVATNALNQAGVVTGTTAANANQVWGTNGLGVPGWITPVNDDWHIIGNTGTNSATNFIGTIDNTNFVTRTNNLRRSTVFNDGRIKIGSGTNFAYGLSRMEIEGEGVQPHISYVSDYPSFIMMRHQGTLAAPTSLNNGDNVGEIRWYGYNTSSYYQTARILSYVDGPPVANAIPGSLIFMTNTAGNSVTDEKMIIKNNGNVGIGTFAMGGPLAKLHVFATGANWNVATSNGDFYVGDATYRFKLGVATGGGGAGDVRLSAHGGTNRLFLGGGTNTNVAVVDGTNQRVGVNTFDPNTGLDVVGDIALKTTAATLTGTAPNFAVNTTTTPRSYYRVSSPTANFNILSLNNPANAGGTGTVDGRVVTLYNATTFTMTLSNQNAGATAAERIITGTGANLTINAGGTVTLVYNTTDSRWVVKDYSNEAGGSAWNLTGNTGTTPATNFIGTTDNVDFVTRTNNTEVMRATNAQRIGIGVTAPTTKLEVNSGTGDAIYGHSSNVGGYLGYETNFIVGTAGTIQGAGVWAANPAAGYTSLYAQSSGAATVAASINFSNVWIASYSLVDNSSATFNPSASYAQLNNTSATMGAGAFKNAIYGYSNRGTTAGNPGYTVGLNGIANSQNEDAIGVVGRAFCNSGFTLGGYFEGNNYAGTNVAYAYVGGNDGFGATKITGTGAVAEIVPTPNHGRVKLFCPESPEYWYQDYGTVNLTEGFAHVELDPILAEIIVVNEENPIKVFATPVNMLYFEGVTITNQTATGFDLVELNGAKHSGKVDYQLICKPKTNFGQGRFPQGRGPAWLKPEMEPAAAKAANQPRDIFYWPADHIQYNYNPEDMIPVGEIVPAGPHAGMFKLGDGTFSRNLPVNKDDLKAPATNK